MLIPETEEASDPNMPDVYPEFEDDEDTAAESADPDRPLHLPYPKQIALELWRIWNDHAIMPHAGGYLDQPSAWRRMIAVLDTRYAAVYGELKTAQDEAKREADLYKAAMRGGGEEYGDLM